MKVSNWAKEIENLAFQQAHNKNRTKRYKPRIDTFHHTILPQSLNGVLEAMSEYRRERMDDKDHWLPPGWFRRYFVGQLHEY